MALGMESYIVQWAADDAEGNEAIFKKENVQGPVVPDLVGKVLEIGAHWVEVTVEP